MHATVSTIFKTTEGKKVDRGLKRNPVLGFPQEGIPNTEPYCRVQYFQKGKA